MFWTFPLMSLTMLPTSVIAQHQLVATHEDISALVSAGGRAPRWTNKRLAGCDICEGAPILYTIDSSGRRETVALDIPGSDDTVVYNVAAGSDGSLAAVGFAVNGTSRMGSFIAWFSPDRSRQVITRLWPYGAQAIAVAPDGTIWTVGAVANDRYVAIDPNVLRHYTPSGQLLTSTKVANARKSTGGLSMVADASALMVSNDRVGWLTRACQYIEFSLDGVELGRYSCPDGKLDILPLGGVALSPTDDLVIATKQAAPLAPVELDRETGAWNPVPVSQDAGKTNRILGFDGRNLVTLAFPLIRRYAWSDAPRALGQPAKQ
jgi:hypothetical protein